MSQFAIEGRVLCKTQKRLQLDHHTPCDRTPGLHAAHCLAATMIDFSRTDWPYQSVGRSILSRTTITIGWAPAFTVPAATSSATI